ncbi:MAG: 50S ribosomal protein L32 [Candidatus Brennerbacteria bacterium]|nr:50S ribosomal protein L32 [Candidatus Brennerbacteria bacterium]
MGGVPVKHHSKSKVGRRRSQQALEKRPILACPNCKGPTMAHRICPQCGKYTKNPKP